MERIPRLIAVGGEESLVAAALEEGCHRDANRPRVVDDQGSTAPAGASGGPAPCLLGSRPVELGAAEGPERRGIEEELDLTAGGDDSSGKER